MAEPVPAHEMSRELVNLFHRAADSSETLTVDAIREELGVGHDDLEAMLGQLRERGIASEVAPGEWAAGDQELPGQSAEAEPVVVHVDGEPGELVEEDAPGAGWAPMVFEPDVRITRAIADALDAEAIGKLVKAGLGDARPDQSFLLEITP